MKFFVLENKQLGITAGHHYSLGKFSLDVVKTRDSYPKYLDDNGISGPVFFTSVKKLRARARGKLSYKLVSCLFVNAGKSDDVVWCELDHHCGRPELLFSYGLSEPVEPEDLLGYAQTAGEALEGVIALLNRFYKLT